MGWGGQSGRAAASEIEIPVEHREENVETEEKQKTGGSGGVWPQKVEKRETQERNTTESQRRAEEVEEMEHLCVQ